MRNDAREKRRVRDRDRRRPAQGAGFHLGGQRPARDGRRAEAAREHISRSQPTRRSKDLGRTPRTARPRLSRNHSRGYGSACDEASGLGRKSRSFRYPHAYPMRCYLERGVIAAPPVQDHVDERVFLAHHDLVKRRAQNPLTRKRLWRMEVTMPARDRHRAASTVVAPDRPMAEAWTQPWRRSRPLIGPEGMSKVAKRGTVRASQPFGASWGCRFFTKAKADHGVVFFVSPPAAGVSDSATGFSAY